MSPFTNFLGFLISIFAALWVIPIFVTTSPQERMERACAPVTWTGKIGSSVAMLLDGSERTVNATQRSFAEAEYGCRFTLWRLVYEDDWKREQARAAQEREALEQRSRQQPDARPAGQKSKP